MIQQCSSTRNAVAIYKYGTEGLEVYIPGSGINLKMDIVYNLAGAGGSVTCNYYRSVSSWLTQLLEQLHSIKLFLLMK